MPTRASCRHCPSSLEPSVCSASWQTLATCLTSCFGQGQNAHDLAAKNPAPVPQSRPATYLHASWGGGGMLDGPFGFKNKEDAMKNVMSTLMWAGACAIAACLGLAAPALASPPSTLPIPPQQIIRMASFQPRPVDNSITASSDRIGQSTTRAINGWIYKVEYLKGDSGWELVSYQATRDKSTTQGAPMSESDEPVMIGGVNTPEVPVGPLPPGPEDEPYKPTGPPENPNEPVGGAGGNACDWGWGTLDISVTYVWVPGEDGSLGQWVMTDYQISINGSWCQ